MEYRTDSFHIQLTDICILFISEVAFHKVCFNNQRFLRNFVCLSHGVPVPLIFLILFCRARDVTVMALLVSSVNCGSQCAKEGTFV